MRAYPSRLGALLTALFSVLPVTTRAETVEPPQFRTGLWRFERTIELVRRPPATNLIITKTEATRCVVPNVAMAGIFFSPNIANCRSEKPQLFGNQYIFPNRCDVMGPVSTVITAASDVSYSELNVLPIEPLPRRDMVIAQRVGDCTTPNSQAFAEGSSVNSRRNR